MEVLVVGDLFISSEAFRKAIEEELGEAFGPAREVTWGGETPEDQYHVHYGSPHGDGATAGFFGLRGWHGRGHLLKALFEGTVFNHNGHVDTLRSAFELTRVRLTGGGSRSEIWSQMFADALNLPVEVTEADEAGVLGAAVCAGIGTGVRRT